MGLARERRADERNIDTSMASSALHILYWRVSSTLFLGVGIRSQSGNRAASFPIGFSRQDPAGVTTQSGQPRRQHIRTLLFWLSVFKSYGSYIEHLWENFRCLNHLRISEFCKGVLKLVQGRQTVAIASALGVTTAFFPSLNYKLRRRGAANGLDRNAACRLTGLPIYPWLRGLAYHEHPNPLV